MEDGFHSLNQVSIVKLKAEIEGKTIQEVDFGQYSITYGGEVASYPDDEQLVLSFKDGTTITITSDAGVEYGVSTFDIKMETTAPSFAHRAKGWLSWLLPTI